MCTFVCLSTHLDLTFCEATSNYSWVQSQGHVSHLISWHGPSMFGCELQPDALCDLHICSLGLEPAPMLPGLLILFNDWFGSFWVSIAIWCTNNVLWVCAILLSTWLYSALVQCTIEPEGVCMRRYIMCSGRHIRSTANTKFFAQFGTSFTQHQNFNMDK